MSIERHVVFCALLVIFSSSCTKGPGAGETSGVRASTAALVAPKGKSGGGTQGPGSEGKHYPVSDQPAMYLQMQPPDQTSLVSSTPLKVRLVSMVTAITTEVLNEVAGEVELLRWPGRQPIAVQTTVAVVQPPGYGSNGGPQQASGEVVVQPSEALAPDQWYALRVKKLPKDVAVADPLANLVEPDGSVLGRFTPSSRPVAGSVRRCPKEDRDLVIVDFSERVTAGAFRKGSINIKALGSSCPEVVLEGLESALNLTFSCGKGSPDEDVDLEVDNLQSHSEGKPVEVVDPEVPTEKKVKAKVKLKKNGFKGRDDGCLAFKLPNAG